MPEGVRGKDLELIYHAIQCHHAFVFRLALRFLHNHADAEDITQAVFLKLILSLEHYARVKSQRAWLAQITLNESISLHRSEGRRRRREETWAADRQRREKREPREATDDVAAALSALPDELRIPVILHYQEGLKFREIAEACSCPLGTVAHRITQAKEKLRSRLGGGGAIASFTILGGLRRQARSLAAPEGLEKRLLRTLQPKLGATGRLCQPGGAGRLRARGPRKPTGGKIIFLPGAAMLAVSLGVGFWVLNDLARAPEQKPLSPAREVSKPARPNNGEGRAESPRRKAPAAGPVAAAITSKAEPPKGDEAAPVFTGAPAGGPRLFGWVSDPSGRPLPGAAVAIMGAPGDAAMSTTLTDAEGYYEFQDLLVGSNIYFTNVAAKAGGGLSFAPAGIEMPVLLEGAAQDYLKRAEAELVSTWVRKSPAPPLTTQLQLEAMKLTNEYIRTGVWDSLQTGQQLEFLDYAGAGAAPKILGRGPLHVAARLDGYEASISPLMFNGQDPLQVDFTLQPAMPLSGLVVSDSGVPVAGADVVIAAQTGMERLPVEALSAKTDDAGRFSFLSLPRAAYALRASAAGFAAAEAVAQSGETGAVLRLAPGGSVRVKVARRETGEALSGFQVELLDGGWVAAKSVTGEDGETKLDDLPAGTYTVNTYRETSQSRFSRGRNVVQVRAGETSEIAVEVHASLAIHGRVLLESGEEEQDPEDAGQLSVAAVPLDVPREAAGGLKTVPLDAAGAFVLKGLPPGPYVLAVRRVAPAGNSVLTTLEVILSEGEPVANVEISLRTPDPATLRVAVRDGAGRPISGMRVDLARGLLEPPAVEKSRSDPGLFEARCPPGRFALTVKARGYRSRLLENVVLAAGDLTELAVELEPAEIDEEPANDLASYFFEGAKLMTRATLRLSTFLDLLKHLETADVALAPAVHQAGLLERAVVSGNLEGEPAGALKSALDAHGLAARPSRGRLWISY